MTAEEDITVLVVDDDRTLVELLSDYLRLHGNQVVTAHDGVQALDVLAERRVDLVLMDVTMPRMDGWTLCERLREHSDAPVVMLTARGDEMDKLRGFRLGVDDYVTKPFSFAEVAARLQAVLGRNRRRCSPRDVLRVGGVEIDVHRRHVEKNGRTVALTPTEYRLFEHLARNVGRPVSGHELVAAVWGSAFGCGPGHLKRVVWGIRQKTEEDPGNPVLVATVRGYGYRLNG